MMAIKPNTRARLVECALAVGVVTTGWHFLLKPAERALAQDRERLSTEQTQVSDAEGLTSSVATIEADSAKAEATVKSLSAAQGVSAVSSRLYDSVNRLAASHAVKVLRLDPTGLHQVSPPQNRVGPQTAAQRGEVQEYRITVQGSYQSVASFIHACEHSLGTSAITRFRIIPVADSPRGDVEATVETAHLRFLDADAGGRK